MKVQSKIVAIGSVLVLVGGFMLFQTPRAVARADESTTTTPQSTSEPKTLTDEQKAQIKSRVEKYKTQAGAANKTAEARIKLRCNVAQTVSKNLRGKAVGLRENRVKAYKKVSDRLALTVTKLKEKQIDTAKLEEQIATLNTKITAFNTAIDTYKQSVDDMADMDCAADPSGFKAALDQARIAQRTMHTLATEIRTYVINAIKPTLIQLRSELAKQSTTDGGDNNASEQ